VPLRNAKVISEYDMRIAFLTYIRHKEELVQKEGAVKIARVEVEKAQLEVDKHVVRSPCDGTVLTVHFASGEAIRERTTLMRIRVRQARAK
jgi:multidrug resistance efflux pump